VNEDFLAVILALPNSRGLSDLRLVAAPGILSVAVVADFEAGSETSSTVETVAMQKASSSGRSGRGFPCNKVVALDTTAAMTRLTIILMLRLMNFLSQVYGPNWRGPNAAQF
jgi:hypothetical protein